MTVGDLHDASVAFRRSTVPRRTDLPVHEFERPLRCVQCGNLVLVFEASNVGAHEHLDVAVYRCGDCMTVEVMS